MERPAELTAPGLLAQIRQKQLCHCAEHADVHGADLARRYSVELDAGEGEPIVHVGDVGQLPAEPVERLHHDDVERVALDIGDQLLVAGAKAARPAHRAILVCLHEDPALPLSEAPAHLDLVLDRGLALVLAAVAGVDDGAHDLSSHIRRRRKGRATSAVCRRSSRIVSRAYMAARIVIVSPSCLRNHLAPARGAGANRQARQRARARPRSAGYARSRPRSWHSLEQSAAFVAAE